MTWLLTKLLSAFLLPPLNFLILGIAGIVAIKYRPALGRFLLWSMIALLWFFSLPIVGSNLVKLLERGSQLDATHLHEAQAIVTLGGAGGSLEHARYAAVLYRRTRLPILVSGGDPKDSGIFDAEKMRTRLEIEFHVPVMWVEKESQNTIQNAEFSARILRESGINSILLVTHGWHMARAKQLFENAGMHVIPAATGLHYDIGLTALDFLPTPEGLGDSRLFFHEILGMLWTRTLFTELDRSATSTAAH